MQKKENPWIKYVKYIANIKGISYSCALSDKDLSFGYKHQKQLAKMGNNDIYSDSHIEKMKKIFKNKDVEKPVPKIEKPVPKIEKPVKQRVQKITKPEYNYEMEQQLAFMQKQNPKIEDVVPASEEIKKVQNMFQLISFDKTGKPIVMSTSQQPKIENIKQPIENIKPTSVFSEIPFDKNKPQTKEEYLNIIMGWNTIDIGNIFEFNDNITFNILVEWIQKKINNKQNNSIYDNLLLVFFKKYNTDILNRYGVQILLTGIKRIVDYIADEFNLTINYYSPFSKGEIDKLSSLNVKQKKMFIDYAKSNKKF